MPFKSVYLSLDTKEICQRGGYRVLPYMVPRYTIGPREKYGRSPAMLALPDIKMLNEMEKTIIRAGHMAVDPPLLLPDSGVITAFQMRPAALNHGGVDSQGRQMVMPLQTGANFPLGMEMSNQKRELINEAFLVTLFQVLVDNPGNMTATEVLERAQEKGALLAPAAGRLQTELLGPMIEREIDLLVEAGRVPPPPRELVEAGGENGIEFEVEYESPIMRAMKSGEGVAIARTLEILGPLAELDPSVTDLLNAEEMFKVSVDVFGAPARILRTAEEIAAIREQRQQDQQMQQMLEAAPVAAQTAKTLAEAQQMAGAV
jgi:hypothetical protein